MRHLDTSAISDTNGFKFKGGTFTHLQAAYGEAIGEAAKALIGAAYDSAKVYVLSGCVNSGSGSNYIISAGSVFFNGEIYLVDAATFTISGPNVAVGSIVTSFFAAGDADPVDFTDGVSRNVHQIKKVVYAPGLSGSGVGDYSQLVSINANIAQVNITGSGAATVSGTYPNKNISVTPTALLKGTFRIGDVNTASNLDANATLLSGGGDTFASYRYVFPTPPGVDTYFPILSIRNNSYLSSSDLNHNFGCNITIGQKSATDLYFAISVESAGSGNIQDIYIDYVLISA